jgi:hypothetical protein
MQAKGIRVGEKHMKTGQVLIIINIGCGFICWCLKCLMFALELMFDTLVACLHEGSCQSHMITGNKTI